MMVKRKCEANTAMSGMGDLHVLNNRWRGIGYTKTLRAWSVIAVLGWSGTWSNAWAAEMSVGDVRMRANRTAGVVVSGSIDGESTFGWTIMLELTPREGNRGTVTFTPEPAGHPRKRPSLVIVKNSRGVDAVQIEQVHREGVDISQLRDVWLDIGTFTAYDTLEAGSDILNGAVDENGTFLPTPVSFSGALASFPVVASPNARGVWDVTLWTPAGESNWEGVETTLVGGTITVSQKVCRKHRDCNDRNPCTDDTCVAGACENVRNERPCRDSDVVKKRGRK